MRWNCRSECQRGRKRTKSDEQEKKKQNLLSVRYFAADSASGGSSEGVCDDNADRTLSEHAVGWRKKRRERNIQIQKSGWEQAQEACFDQKWTEEAVYNILDNALKYTGENTQITIRVEVYELFVRIRIQDEGPGVKEDEAPLLFKRFYRSPRFCEQEGVGLGLYLAREILRKEGGYIKVASPKEGGCEFSVYLKRS